MVLMTMEFQQLVSPVPLHVLLAIADSQLPALVVAVHFFDLSAFLQLALVSAPLLIMIQVYSCVSPALPFALLVGAQPQIALPVIPPPITAPFQQSIPVSVLQGMWMSVRLLVWHVSHLASLAPCYPTTVQVVILTALSLLDLVYAKAEPFKMFPYFARLAHTHVQPV